MPFNQEYTEAPDFTACVQLDCSVLPVINFAMQHNGAAVIQSITLENQTDTDFENLEIRISSTPEFALPFVQHLNYLPSKKTFTIRSPKMILNGEFLAGLTEKLNGIVTVSIYQGTELLATQNLETTILAFDEWQGAAIYPEMLAAFVTPNHPRIAAIIARATVFLGQWTGDTSMDAYQSQDPNRVVSQAAAIYTAIKEQAIAYCVSPASFEAVGQRVRLCDMVLTQKLGTCLDLTLLYAACLEAAGLYPLLILTRGHIFTGVWLEEKMFPECVQDDASLLTKRLASGINEIAVAETTCVTSGRELSFDEARQAGEQNLSKQVLDCIIDIRRARLSGISPIPHRVHTESGWSLHYDTPKSSAAVSAPKKLDETVAVDTSIHEESLPKKAQWERKLLDLGMRNTLINLRLTKTQIPILTDSLDDLENALASGRDFSILHRPGDLPIGDFSFESLCEVGGLGIIRAEFENKRLRSVLSETELAKTIKGLYRTAKTALEENGANTLYLALGMLRWFENKRSTKPRYAPILLLPIEMVRKSAAQGYIIRMRDDEPQMNITLLEKLKQDFGIIIGGLDPLPADEQGIDIRKVLTIIRKAVMEQPHWDVIEAASVGIFSFSQFVMWNDIRNRSDDLLRNKIVRSLMEGRLTWDAQPLELGQQVNEDNVLLPMSADASQLFAIQAACGGESFVLHGPPGTGKSQTITSLIANALAQGKTVLFVAEKMAALEVVQKRLERIGIGAFCLELHSNKSRKKDVLEQLRRASEVTKATTAKAYEARAEQIASLRTELDSYVRQLHKPLPCGSTLFTLISEYEAVRDAADIERFDTPFIRGLDASAIDTQRLLVERLVAAGTVLGHPAGYPLSPIGCTRYSQSLRSSLSDLAEAYRLQLETITPPVQALSDIWSIEITSEQDLENLHALSVSILPWYEMPRSWAKVSSPGLFFEEITQMAQLYHERNALAQNLLTIFRPDFLTQDGEKLFAEYMEVSTKWFLPKFFGTNKLVKQLNLFALAPIDKDQLQTYIQALRDYQRLTAQADILFDKHGESLEHLYKGGDTDWEGIATLATTAKENADYLYTKFGSYDFMHRHCGSSQIQGYITQLQAAYSPFTEAMTAFYSLLCISSTIEDNWLNHQHTMCRNIVAHSDHLKEWIAYNAAVEEAEAAGLGNVVESYRAGADHEDILPSWRKVLLQGLICDAIDTDDTLNQFSGAVFNQKIDQYRRMDTQWTELSRQEIYCRLAAKVPNFTQEAAHSSELGILQRCIKSGGRGVSIRKLFEQIPNLLPRLCPCMLMSPISAAQYLDPNCSPFDIVVFDEASQMPTCKAVGVLARGTDAVIVGDPKQMPPTSFFATNTVDEDNLDVEDLESILDDCLALNMPQSHLLWHYRSRHESLIAFSNSHFYENRLFTFPSVNDRESKVTLVPVDGVFERGKTRVNKEEAKAVVTELIRRYRDPELSRQSIGVVTFNISQQHLIDDLLSEAFAADPELEKWAIGGEEPVFIKNLENVQGDERDVILFSVGYGPDSEGKVSMNFGPLNRDGGWRRLNVAVSRARCEMMVFSTLRAEQIDLNRTKAEGVLALRNFLAYAEGRPLIMDEHTVTPHHSSTGIAEAICAFLESHGYETDLSVGRSEYRIDIGVIDPKKPDQYMLGILLDSSCYHSAKTTRDRELAQISVLQGLGWNILRVWSMDWWDNREKECNRILGALQDIENGIPAAPTEEAPVKLEAMQPVVEVSEAPILTDAPMYTAAKLPMASVSPEDFVTAAYTQQIKSRIKTVLTKEAPVCSATVIRRVVQSYGITRAGSRIQARMDTLLGRMKLKTTTQGDTVFYWLDTQNPEDYALFRVNGDEENRRDIREVPIQEIANAICLVLHQQISMAQEDLVRETAKKLGYSRSGGNVLTAVETGFLHAQAKGYITPGAGGSFVLTDTGSAKAEAVITSFRC